MAAHRVIPILLMFFYFNILQHGYSAVSEEKDDKVISNIKRLKDKLFNSTYDKNVRPESHHNDTTHVLWDIAPLYVIELNEEKSLFTLDSWLFIAWTDKRLKWNPSDYDGLDKLNLPDHYVWQPDIVFYNAHSSNVDPVNESHIIIHSDGSVYWFPPATVTVFCDVTTPVGSYPYDTHVCNITAGSWNLDGWQMNVLIFEETLYWGRFSNTNPRWEVDRNKTRLYRVVEKYECCEEPYISIDATFTLKRRIPAEIQVIFIPSVLVMILTLTMFWIPSDAGGKKIIIGCALLIILAALTIYGAAMTSSPLAPQLAVSSVQSTMIAVAVAVALEVLLVSLSCMKGPRKPPEFLVRPLSGSLGDYMCVWRPWQQSLPGDKVHLHDNEEQTNSEPTAQQEWLMIVTACDRVLFVLYIAVFAAIHQV